MIRFVKHYIFSQGYFLTYFSFLLIYGGLGVGVLGLWSWIGFVGLGFSFDGVWGLWCKAFWVFWGWGSLNKYRRISLGKNFA